MEKKDECTRWCYYLKNLTENNTVQKDFEVKTGPRVWFLKRSEDSEYWARGWVKAHAGGWSVAHSWVSS